MKALAKIIEKIKATMSDIKHRLSHESCYDQMEDLGYAVFGKCSGMDGGNKLTDYTAEFCLDCPYFTPTKIEEE